jgi:hypothetical protein
MQPELGGISWRQCCSPGQEVEERPVYRLLSMTRAQSQACRGCSFIYLGFTKCLLSKGFEVAYQIKLKHTIKKSKEITKETWKK